MELTLENIKNDPYQNFVDYLSNDQTRDMYLRILKKFLNVIPKEIFEKNLQKSGNTIPELTTLFVELAHKDIELVKQIDEKIDNYQQRLLEKGFDPDPNRNFKLYWMFGIPASMFFVALLILSLVVLLVEKMNLGIQRGTAMRMFKISIVSLALIYAVPEIWDPIAIVINNTGLYMLDPIDGKPHETTQKLFCRMGIIV